MSQNHKTKVLSLQVRTRKQCSKDTVILRNRPRCERDANEMRTRCERDANEMRMTLSRKGLENVSKACQDVLR